MIWISIHLHSLPGDTSSVAPVFVSAPRDDPLYYSVSCLAELRSLSYECSARAVGARFIAVEMRCGRTSKQHHQQPDHAYCLAFAHAIHHVCITRICDARVYQCDTVYRTGQSEGGGVDGMEADERRRGSTRRVNNSNSSP